MSAEPIGSRARLASRRTGRHDNLLRPSPAARWLAVNRVKGPFLRVVLVGGRSAGRLGGAGAPSMLRGEKRAGGRVGAPLMNQSKPGATVPRGWGAEMGLKVKSPSAGWGFAVSRHSLLKVPNRSSGIRFRDSQVGKKRATSESMLFTRDSKHTQNAGKETDRKA